MTMHKIQLLKILVILLILSISIGCSGNPASPDPVQNPQQVTSNSQTDAGIHMNLGSYLIELNTQDQTLEILPLRSSELHINLTKVFIATFGLSLQYLPAESDPLNGEFTVNFTLTHPFGANPEFTAFDVKGIVMAPGTEAVDSVVFSDYNETMLINADGFTRWWNPTEFTQPGIFGYTDGLFANTTAANLTATVNPYKYFADILGPTDMMSVMHLEPLDDDDGRGVFSAGNTITRKYQLDFPLDPTPVILFGYVIDGCWAEPIPNPPLEIPDDFPITANQPEAYDIYSHPFLTSLYYDSESGTGGGLLNVQANIYDWQGVYTGNIANEIASVEFFSPDLFSGGVAGTYLGEIDNKARYSADLTGTAIPTYAGIVPIYIKVTSPDDPAYNQGFGYPAPAEPVKAWDVMYIDITDPDCTGDTNNEFMEAVALNVDEPTYDQLCAPTDYKDFYKFEFLDCQIVTGSITLHCDAEPSSLGLYDSTETLISEIAVSGGSAVLDFDSLTLGQGLYYILVYTQASNQAFFYVLEPDMHLGDPIPPLDPVDVSYPGLNLLATGLESHDNYLYVSNQGLWIYDYTDPNNPEAVSYLDVNIYSQPDLSYPYLVYHSYPDLYYVGVIDVSDPYNPIDYPEIIWTPAEITAQCIDGNYLYVGLMGSLHGMVRIYDISSGFDSPVFVHEFPTEDEPRNFHVIEDPSGLTKWLAVETSWKIIRFLNITYMESLGSSVDIDFGSSSIRTTCGGENNLFVTRTDAGNYYLTSIKAGISGPTIMGSAAFTDYPSRMDVEGGFAYISSDSAKNFTVVDLTDPDLPTNPVSYPAGVFMLSDIEAMGDQLHIACYAAGIESWSIVNPNAPVIIGREVAISYVSDFAVADDYIYVLQNWADYPSVKVIDNSDPGNARVISELVTKISAGKICQAGNMIVCSSWDSKLELIGCTDPFNLNTDSFFSYAGAVNFIAMNESALYVGYNSNMIEIWDLSTWPAITSNQTGVMPGKVEDILLYGDYMYVATGSDINIYSITNPISPSFITSYTPVTTSPRCLAARGNNLFITSDDNIEIADISTPSAPVFVTSLTLPNAFDRWFVDVDEYFAYVMPKDAGPVQVIDICPLSSAALVGPLFSEDHDNHSVGLAILDGYYYEGEGTWFNICWLND